MKTIEEIIEEITAEAATAYELSMGSNWHRLVLTAEGEIYWAEEVGQSSMSVAVWNGSDCSLMHFQGQSHNGYSEEAYEMIEASAEIAAADLAAAAVRDALDASDRADAAFAAYTDALDAAK